MSALSPQRGETVPDGLCGASREAVPPPQHRGKFHGSRAVRCLSEAVPLGNGNALPRVPAAEWGRCTMTFREMVKCPVGNSLLFSSFLCTAVRCPSQHAAMSRGARCDGQCTALRFLSGNGAVGCAERPSVLPPPGLLWGLSFDSIDPLSSLACALGCICSKSWV